MTIYIPKKTFKLIGLGIAYSLLFSWIPFLGIAVYGIIINESIYYVVAFIFMILPLAFSCIWFYEFNREHNVIRWKGENEK